MGSTRIDGVQRRHSVFFCLSEGQEHCVFESSFSFCLGCNGVWDSIKRPTLPFSLWRHLLGGIILLSAVMATPLETADLSIQTSFTLYHTSAVHGTSPAVSINVLQLFASYTVRPHTSRAGFLRRTGRTAAPRAQHCVWVCRQGC